VVRPSPSEHQWKPVKYVYGDIDIEGDLLAGVDAFEEVSDPSRGPGVKIDTPTKRELAKPHWA